MSSAGGTADTRTVYKVSEINRLASAAIENELGHVWIEGELSRVTRPSSGHLYFSLKDEHAVINAAFFRGSQRQLNFQPADGMNVQAYGKLTIYAPRGQYQLVVQQMEEAGQGSLHAAFEKLKKRLAAEGLFEAARKRPLPLFPRCIGIVTSPTGAALQDILNVTRRRFPGLHIVIAPARVQGEGAAEDVAAAIRLLNRHGQADAMIVGRGGGSLEDLWAFNEECVARAIVASAIPVISAVGHEIDFTIADFAADLRAPTPSAAAEVICGSRERLEERLADAARRLAGSLRTALMAHRERFTAARKSYVFREPAHLLARYRQRLDRLHQQLAHRSTRLLEQQQQRLDEAALRARHRLTLDLAARKQDLQRAAAQLRALSPRAVLVRGFSITTDDQGRIVQHAKALHTGDRVHTLLAQSRFTSTVTDIATGDTHGGKEREKGT